MTRTRTKPDDMRALAIEDLAAALTAAGLTVKRERSHSIDVSFDDARFEVDVVPAAYATGARTAELLGEAARGGLPVLVADRVTADARDQLKRAGWGWLDRRGHLHLRSPGMLIDTSVPAASRDRESPHEPIRGRAGLAIAYRLLTRNRFEPISPSRSSMTFAPSTISEALSPLRAAGLVDPDGLPVLPELFWVLAEHWAPDRVWLATEPPVSEAAWHDPGASGWCLTGTIAAVDWGAPVVATETVPDFYVPGPVGVTIAARRYGVARDPQVAAASVAVAPVGDVTQFREWPRAHSWPLAHPVAVALDLAQDRARGREILEDWSPPERVW